MAEKWRPTGEDWTRAREDLERAQKRMELVAKGIDPGPAWRSEWSRRQRDKTHWKRLVSEKEAARKARAASRARERAQDDD